MYQESPGSSPLRSLKRRCEGSWNSQTSLCCLIWPQNAIYKQHCDKTWRTMVNTDPHLCEVFPAPPITAYKVSRNLGTFLIRARVPRPVPIRDKRMRNGMHKCMKNLRGCPVCYYVLETRLMKATATDAIVEIRGELPDFRNHLLHYM